MRIAHIADIHLRLKDRHNEYREVFERLYKSLRDNKVDRITLLGDIVHSKITLSPELVIILEEFLWKLAEIAPVDLIAGNHDCNMSNLERTDAITPCLPKNTKNPINYFTETGLHEIDNGLVYGVWSVLDGKTFKLKNKDPNKTYIALFHGSVIGAELDNNYVMSDTSTSLSTFNNFDIVMMGDIHKFQTFREDHTAVYAGSLIQQNHGETLDKGYLIWDTDTNAFDRVLVENDYGYFTLYATGEDKLPDIDLPSKCRMRVIWPMKAKDISRSSVTRLNTLIYKKYRPLSLQLNFKPIKDDITDEIDLDQGVDIRELSVQQDLLTQWLTLKGIEEDDKDKILSIDEEVYERLDPLTYEDFSNSTWEFKKLTLQNFMSYGVDPTVINFENLRGVIGLFGDNTCGKSVIIDAILYALFNKTTRNVKNEDLVNKYTNSNVCKVTLHLEIRGVDYIVERWTTRLYKAQSSVFDWARTDVILKRKYKDDKEWENLTETQRRETEKIIRNAIGSYEDFLTVTLSTQSQGEEFIKQRPGLRSENMLRFLGLDILLKKHDIAKDLLKDIEFERRQYNSDDEANRFSVLVEDKEEYERLANQHKKERDNIDERISDIRDLIEQLSGSLNRKLTIDKSRDEIVGEIDSLNEELLELKTNIKNLSTKKDKIIEKTSEIEEKFVATEEQLLLLSDERKNCEKLENAIRELKAKIESTKRVLSTYKDLLEDTQSGCPVEYDPNHATCGYLSNYVETKNKCLGLIEELKDQKKELVEKEKELSDLSSCRAIIEEQRSISDQLEMAAIKVQEYVQRISQLNSDKEIKSISLSYIKGQLELLDREEENVKKNKKIRDRLDSAKKKIEELKKNRRTHNDEHIVWETKVGIVDAEMAEIQNRLHKIKSNDKLYFLYNTYCQAMHRDGIPVTVLRQYIPRVNYEINKILSDVVKFGLYFVMSEESTDIRIVMRYDGELDDTRPAQLASGMESLLINFAIRYALISISRLNKPSSWFIDEGFGVLDPNELFSISKFFENVKSTFKNIVMITHIDALKDVADHTITVDKKEGISILNQSAK
jgi:DNA repair exonuclease SbcCD ATPase subunit/predicted phosphodiesterase